MGYSHMDFGDFFFLILLISFSFFFFFFFFWILVIFEHRDFVLKFKQNTGSEG